MTLRFCIQDDSGEPAYYWGEPGSINEASLGQHIHETVKACMERGEREIPFTVFLVEMTDKQVKELPDL